MPLYILPTPIGNLEDITLRTIRLLKESTVIFSEDTRVTKKLLSHLGIPFPTIIPYHIVNENARVNHYVDIIKQHVIAVLVSDAGTPCISDPGFLITRACIDNGIELFTLPGATAFVPALVQSGFPNHSFTFEGFLPHKKGRQSKLLAWKESDKTVIFYESTHRIIKALEQMVTFLGADRAISVSREISKLHEETVRGSTQEVLTYYQNNITKGEFVVCISPKDFKIGGL